MRATEQLPSTGQRPPRSTLSEPGAVCTQRTQLSPGLHPEADWDSPRPSFSHKEAERCSLEAPGFCPLCLGCLAGTTAGQCEWGERGGGPRPLGSSRTQGPVQSQAGHRHTGQRAPRLQLQTEKPLSVRSGEAESRSAWGSPAWMPDSTASDLVSVSGIARLGLRHSSESFLDIKELFYCSAQCSRAGISHAGSEPHPMGFSKEEGSGPDSVGTFGLSCLLGDPRCPSVWSSFWEETYCPGLIQPFPNSQTLNSSPQAHLGSLGYTVPSWQKPLAGSKERISSLDGQQTQALLVTCFLGSGSQVPPRGDAASETGPVSRDARFPHDFPACTTSSFPCAGALHPTGLCLTCCQPREGSLLGQTHGHTDYRSMAH